MAKAKTTPYDVVDHLRTPAEMAAYLEACQEEGDAELVAKAKSNIARAKKIIEAAR